MATRDRPSHPLALPTTRVTRRSLLVGAGAVALLAACGSDDDGGVESGAGSTGDTTSSGAASGRFLIASVPPARFFAQGIPQRAPLLILEDQDGNLLPMADPPESFEVEVLFAGNSTGEPELEGDPIEVTLHDEGIPQFYYPLTFTPAQTGNYQFRTRLDGEEVGAPPAQTVNVSPVSAVPLPQVGDPMIPVDTPTVDDHRGVEPYCTLNPPCPLHEVTVTDALAAGGPVALLISTPAFCQTAICGPVLDLLVEEAAGRDLTAIHAEVYTDAAEVGDITQAGFSPALEAYGMVEVGYEPALFVGDADGNVAARLDLSYDAAELRDALDLVS